MLPPQFGFFSLAQDSGPRKEAEKWSEAWKVVACGKTESAFSFYGSTFDWSTRLMALYGTSRPLSEDVLLWLTLKLKHWRQTEDSVDTCWHANEHCMWLSAGQSDCLTASASLCITVGSTVKTTTAHHHHHQRHHQGCSQERAPSSL